MSWNKVIERAKQETSYRLGNRLNGKNEAAIILQIIMVVNDDGVPCFWSIEGKRIEPQGQAMELIKAFMV